MPIAPRSTYTLLIARLQATVVLVLLFLLFPVVATRAASEQATPQSIPGDPAAIDILARASARLAAIGAVHFDLAIEGTTYIDKTRTIQLLEADGDLSRPDSVATEFKIKVAVATLSVQLITIGEESWSTNIVTGDWGSAPAEFGYSPAILFDTQNGIGPVMGKVKDARLLPDEEIDGRRVHHVAGLVDQEVIGPITGDTMSGSPVAVDLWIDRETDDLLRARLAEPETPENDDPATWTLELTDHGKQVTIESPD